MPIELTPEDRRLLEQRYLLLQELERRMQTQPLAFKVLWDSERTSQRRAAQNLGERVTAIIGGNRSGKTALAAMLAACAVLGRDSDEVRAFCKANGIDPTCFPKAPTRVCCTSLSSNESVRVQRPYMADLLPGLVWRNKDGAGEASADHPNGSKLFFKSADQGAGAFQADQWDWFWCDEEPPEPVWKEGRMRLVDRRGRAILSMTPLKGRTWVWEQYWDDPEPGSKTHTLNSLDNPNIPREEIEAILRTYGPHERAARERGEFTTMEGRVYEFARHLHVIEPMEIPADWPRYVGIDFGTRNPFAAVWGALDPADDTLHVYREYYQRERPLSLHAAELHRLGALDTRPVQKRERDRPVFQDGQPVYELNEDGSVRHEVIEPEWYVADPADAGARLALGRDHGIYTRPALKDIGQGINAVADRLRPDAEGKPHLLIHSCCRSLIREFEGYVWAPSSSRSDPKDAPLKQNDHALDALRYLVFTLQRDLAAA